MLELVATLSVALVAVTVGVRLDGGGLDLRTALVVLLLAPEAYWPLRRVGAEFHAAAEGVATFERVDELLSATSSEVSSGPGRPGDLVVDGVTVTYSGRVVPALDRVSLVVPRTGITAVTGASGSGKSTLLSVLAGLRTPDAGHLSVGGQPVGGDAWRAQVALLPQRPVFVAGSIADNVRLGAPTASDAEVWRVLRRVALEERVRQLPRGLDTELGEDGATLSAGERARLSLARIVLSDRPWILLDEPTAHLDALTEHVVSDTLVELARDRAVVVVAHRPALVGLAEHVVHLAASAAPVTETPAPVRAAAAARIAPLTPSASYRRPRLLLPTVVGGLASLSGVALTATSGWLIVQASTRPAVLTLLVAIVGVRTFGLARPVLRYVERLWSHDTALGLLARRRAEVYDALVPLTPARLGPRRGDVLASVVDDVDSVLDRELRSRIPLRGLAIVGGTATVVTGLLDPRVGAVVAGTCLVGARRLSPDPCRRGPRRAARRRRSRAALGARGRDHPGGRRAAHVAGGRACRDGRGRRPATRSRPAPSAVRAGSGSAARSRSAAAAPRSRWSRCSRRPQVTAGDLGAPIAALLVLVPLALGEVVVPVVDAGTASARARAAESRLSALLSLTPAVTAPAVPADAPDSTAVEVSGVTAAWDDRPALRDLSLSVPSGRRVGIVGPSGSGKSTLASLLLRFVDPVEGSVRLGGVELPRLALDDVRRTVGLVDDDPHVFATTVAENIRLARPDASDDEIDAALREPGSSSGSTVSPTVSPPGSGTARAPSRAASAPGWPWRGRCWPTSGCSSSTSRRPISTTRRPSSWRPRCWVTTRPGGRLDHARTGRARPCRRDRAPRPARRC